jgi:hypothetical protein
MANILAASQPARHRKTRAHIPRCNSRVARACDLGQHPDVDVQASIGTGGCVLAILWASAWDVLIKTQRVAPIYRVSTLELITFGSVLFFHILCRFRREDKK